MSLRRADSGISKSRRTSRPHRILGFERDDSISVHIIVRDVQSTISRENVNLLMCTTKIVLDQSDGVNGYWLKLTVQS